MKKILILLTSMLVITACQGAKGEIKEEETKVEEIVQAEKTEKDIILGYIENMSLEDKIGQILMPTLEEDLMQYNLGGVILFQEDIKSKEETQELINKLKDESNLVPFIGVDEEGGLVSRIAANKNMGYEPIAEVFEIGQSGDLGKAYEIAEGTGKMLNELGFNMNFAPVADIWTNPDNTVIGRRSFGTDKDLVSQMVVSTMKGLKSQNIIAVAKHFPGHGDTKEDSHQERAFVSKTLEELKELELVPFAAAIKEGIDAIMLGHIDLPNVDKEYPATLSKTIAHDILQDDMGFEGLVITDALNMKGITDEYGAVEAAILSFNAGADILLMPDIHLVYPALIEAYKDGDISQERLNESVYKILHIKSKYGIIDIKTL